MAFEDKLVQIEQIVKPQYDRLKLWAHAWPHVRRVATNSRDLALLTGADPIACQIAAYCHDLGRVVEEATTGAKTDLGNADHSLDSIELTSDLLKEVGVKGYTFSSVVGAVAVHADKLYHGKNLVAKVLMDSDKRDSLGPWGTLRHINHHWSHDLVDTEEIMQNQNNPRQIRILADETLRRIKEGDVTKKDKYLKVLGFVLEWIDNKMLGTEQAYDFVRQDYEFTKQSKAFLLK